MKKIRVAVDFDGCLVQWEGFDNEDFKFLDGAKSTINDLSKKGFEFILNTVRYGKPYVKAIEFLMREKVDIRMEDEWEHKIPADIYIDDRNLFCDRIDWNEIRKELEKMTEK